MEAIFDPERKAGEWMTAVDRIQCSIREHYPIVKYIYIDPECGERYRTGVRFKPYNET